LEVEMKIDFGVEFSIPISNIWSGIGSAMAIGGNYYRHSQEVGQRLSDFRALQSDWQMVGCDLGDIMSSHPHDASAE
jgi:hypothetical protein